MDKRDLSVLYKLNSFFFSKEKEQLPLHLACARSGNNAVSITQAVLRATNRNLRLNPDKVR